MHSPLKLSGVRHRFTEIISQNIFQEIVQNMLFIYYTKMFLMHYSPENVISHKNIVKIKILVI